VIGPFVGGGLVFLLMVILFRKLVVQSIRYESFTKLMFRNQAHDRLPFISTRQFTTGPSDRFSAAYEGDFQREASKDATTAGQESVIGAENC
jgi:hypothetical protein